MNDWRDSHIRGLGRARADFRKAAIDLIDGGWADQDELRPRMEAVKAAYEALDRLERHS